MNYEIKPATPQDTEELAQLVNSAYRGETSREGWTTEADYLDGQRTSPGILLGEIEKSSTCTILCLRERAGGSILSCVFLERQNERDCYLGMLTVNPRLQAKGLGRILLSSAEEFAQRWGASRMVLGVVHLRESLIAWYERRGYRKTGEQEPFPYGDVEFGLPKIEGLHFLMFEKNLTRGEGR